MITNDKPKIQQMIDKESIQSIVEQEIQETDLFVVEIKIDTANNISVFLDGDNGVTIDQCVAISRSIEGTLDRDKEDFALEVSSAGIGEPFKVHRQYQKAIGKQIEVLFSSGIKIKGTLTQVNEQNFEIKYTKKEKPEGAKRPKLVEKTETVSFDDIKSVTELLEI